MKNMKIKNINRFVSFIIIIVLALVIVLISVLSIGNRSVGENTDISKLDSSKYSEKILSEYEKDGKKDEFLKDYDMLQNAVGVYMLENVTLEEGSFKNIINEINNKLSQEDFAYFSTNKPTKWNGKWSVDESGNVKFKFDTKAIEPSWIKDESIKEKIILN